MRRTIDAAEARFDRGDHQVAHILALDALRGDDKSHRLTITAVEREGDADFFNVRRITELPMLWSDQWRALGIQSPAAADA